MQVTEIRSTENLSARAGGKISLPTASSKLPEGFAVTWRREMDAGQENGTPDSTVSSDVGDRGTSVKLNVPIELRAATPRQNSARGPLGNTAAEASEGSGSQEVQPRGVAAREARLVEMGVGRKSATGLRKTESPGAAMIVKQEPPDAAVGSVAVGTALQVAGLIPAQAASGTGGLSRVTASAVGDVKKRQTTGPGADKPSTMAKQISTPTTGTQGSAAVVQRPAIATSEEHAGHNRTGTQGGGWDAANAGGSSARLVGSIEAESVSVATTSAGTNAAVSGGVGHAGVQGSKAEMRLAPAASSREVAAGSPQVMAASPTRLELGVFDGTHGWLRIRAELSAGGGVNASLMASATAHDSLRGTLPAMANYLQMEAISVDKIVVNRVAESAATTRAQSQMNDAAGNHRQSQHEAQHGVDVPKVLTAAGEAEARRPLVGQSPDAAGSACAAAPTAAASSANSWVRGLARMMPQLGGSFACGGGTSGGWLNVCA